MTIQELRQKYAEAIDYGDFHRASDLRDEIAALEKAESVDQKPEAQRKWLIYSLEHSLWWKAKSHGYTPRRIEAGKYSFNEAKEIVDGANQFIADGHAPNEAMIPVDE